ncbi:MAG: tol-pal system-associated acyl-CoA thioesterase [Paucibacter sp.]|nr:tol-pal system-associated acyl-CoA thioesterase [Roseateles sp.]
MPVKPFEHRVRVYWEDTDAGGIVFYANYLKFFERARTEWLRSIGFGQQAMREDTGLIFVVASTSVRYLQSARLDDELRVTVEPRETGRASMNIFQQAFRGETLLTEGEIRIGCVESQTLKSSRIPQAILSAIPQ